MTRPSKISSGRAGAKRGEAATKATLTRARAKSKQRRDWRPAFLRGFSQSGTVTGGCAHAGIHRATAYRERQRDPRFAAKWADVEEQLTDRLEARAVELALDGDWHLLEFLLKARKPELYRERQVLEHTGAGGGPIAVDPVNPLGDLERLSDRELTTLQRILTKARDSS